MKEVFVGIDVAKDLSKGHGLNARGETLFSMSFAMNRAGFSKLLDELKSTTQDLSNVLVAMESTACYHINLFSFLTANGVNAVVVNPLLISNFARLSLRKTKTDKKDEYHSTVRYDTQRFHLTVVGYAGSAGSQRSCERERILMSANI